MRTVVSPSSSILCSSPPTVKVSLTELPVVFTSRAKRPLTATLVSAISNEPPIETAAPSEFKRINPFWSPCVSVIRRLSPPRDACTPTVCTVTAPSADLSKKKDPLISCPANVSCGSTPCSERSPRIRTRGPLSNVSRRVASPTSNSWSKDCLVVLTSKSKTPEALTSEREIARLPAAEATKPESIMTKSPVAPSSTTSSPRETLAPSSAM